MAALTLCLAAALAASPIVWMHYFLLLLVPLALIRPRLSPLWLVPFAYWPLGLAAWPGGDAKPLGGCAGDDPRPDRGAASSRRGDAVRPAVRRPLRLPVPERTVVAMKLVMTALAEAGKVLDAQLAYHLHGGVDLVLVPEEAAAGEIGEL